MTSTIDPELLLLHSGWMRALAFELLGDFQAAEDVVQESWMAALDRRPHELRNLPGWLAGVVRHLSLRQGRGEARRRRRERGAARGEVQPGAAEALESFAVQRALVEAVMELASPDREIVVLRYFEELPPRVVAERLGMTGAAVRSRLSRALEKLRRKLDIAHGGERRSWAIALGAWAGRPEVFTSSAGLKLGLLVAGVAAVALVIGVGGSGADEELVPSVGGIAPQATMSAAALSESEEKIGPEGDSSRARRLEASPIPVAGEEVSVVATEDASTPRASIVARLVDSLGRPVEGARASLRGADVGPPVISDSTGNVTLEFEWPLGGGKYDAFVYADLEAEGFASRWMRTRVPRPGVVHMGDVILGAGGSVEGRVLDGRGQPIAGAQVLAGELPEATSRDPRHRRLFGAITLGNQSVRSDADGRYVLDGLPARKLCVFGRTEQSLYVFSPSLVVRAGETVTAPDLVIDRAVEDEYLRGVVLDPEGDPVRGARISVLSKDGLRLGGAVFTDDAGRFELLTLEGKDHRLDISHHDFGGLLVEPVATGDELELRFAPQRWIEVRAKGPDGNSIAPITVRSSESDSYGKRQTIIGGAAKRARLLVPNREFHVVVDAVGWKSITVGPIEPQDAPEQIDVELEPAGGVLGRLTSAGEIVSGASVHLHRVLEPGASMLLTTGFTCGVDPRFVAVAMVDSRGAFQLEVQERGTYALHAERSGRSRATWPTINLTAERAIDLGRLDWGGAGSIEGNLVVEGDPGGRIIAASRGDGHVVKAEVDSKGEFRFEALAPGAWQVRLARRSERGRIERARLAQYPPKQEPAAGVFHDVRVRAGATSHVSLEAIDDSLCTLTGELWQSSGTAVFSNVMLGNATDKAQTTIDGEGRFALRLEGEGPARLNLWGVNARGVRAELWAEVELSTVLTEWRFDPATGSVELRGLGEVLESEQHSNAGPRYGLYRELQERDGAVHFQVELSPTVDTSVLLEDLPVGEYVLRGSSEETRVPLRSAPVLIRFQLGPGATFSHDLGR